MTPGRSPCSNQCAAQDAGTTSHGSLGSIRWTRTLFRIRTHHRDTTSGHQRQEQHSENDDSICDDKSSLFSWFEHNQCFTIVPFNCRLFAAGEVQEFFAPAMLPMNRTPGPGDIMSKETNSFACVFTVCVCVCGHILQNGMKYRSFVR